MYMARCFGFIALFLFLGILTSRVVLAEDCKPHPDSPNKIHCLSCAGSDDKTCLQNQKIITCNATLNNVCSVIRGISHTSILRTCHSDYVAVNFKLDQWNSFFPEFNEEYVCNKDCCNDQLPPGQFGRSAKTTGSNTSTAINNRPSVPAQVVIGILLLLGYISVWLFNQALPVAADHSCVC